MLLSIAKLTRRRKSKISSRSSHLCDWFLREMTIESGNIGEGSFKAFQQTPLQLAGFLRSESSSILHGTVQDSPLYLLEGKLYLEGQSCGKFGRLDRPPCVPRVEGGEKQASNSSTDIKESILFHDFPALSRQHRRVSASEMVKNLIKDRGLSCTFLLPSGISCLVRRTQNRMRVFQHYCSEKLI